VIITKGINMTANLLKEPLFWSIFTIKTRNKRTGRVIAISLDNNARIKKRRETI
jgi:hypothetical protein